MGQSYLRGQDTRRLSMLVRIGVPVAGGAP
jgi:hypothetical protein